MTDRSQISGQGRPSGWILRPIEFALKWGFLALAGLGVISIAGLLGYEIKVDEIFGTKVSLRQKTEVITTIVENNDDKLANLEQIVTKLHNDLVSVSEALERTNTITRTKAEEISELPSKQGVITEPVFESVDVKGTGAIWLGTWNPLLGKWTDASLIDPDKLPKPDSLVNRQFRLGTNVNVRRDFPAPLDDGYYYAVPSLGIAHMESTVKVVSNPRAYSRGSGVQYWAKVETIYRPKSAITLAADD